MSRFSISVHRDYTSTITPCIPGERSIRKTRAAIGVNAQSASSSLFASPYMRFVGVLSAVAILAAAIAL